MHEKPDLLFACLAGICHAQDERVFIPPDPIISVDGFSAPIETCTFTGPELQVNSAFIDSLNAVLFNEKYGVAEAYDLKKWRCFYLHFIKKDPLNYLIVLSINYHPGRGSSFFLNMEGASVAFMAFKLPLLLYWV